METGAVLYLLVGLPGFDRAELVATLLLYRLLYFVAPFAIALVGLALREACLRLNQLRLRGSHTAQPDPPLRCRGN